MSSTASHSKAQALVLSRWISRWTDRQNTDAVFDTQVAWEKDGVIRKSPKRIGKHSLRPSQTTGERFLEERRR